MPMICVQDFEIDELSQEYLSLHPVASQKNPSLVEEHFEAVMENGNENLSDSDASAISESSEDDKPYKKSKIEKKEQAPR